MKITLKNLLLTIPLLAFAVPLSAQEVQVVPYDSIQGTLVDFEDFPAVSPMSAALDSIVATKGLQIAAHFQGQTVSGSPLATLTGQPSTPLTLQAGPPGQNIAIGDSYQITGFENTALYPCGPLGCSVPEGLGEGTFAVLLPGDVSEFGVQMAFASAGKDDTYVRIFRADGSQIAQAIVNANFGFEAQGFGFRRVDGQHDIRGFSVHTTDQDGLGYDNIVFGLVATGS